MENKNYWQKIAIVVVFLALALIWRGYVADYFVRISVDYIFEADHIGDTQTFNPATEEWEDLEETMKRNDIVVEDHSHVVVIRSVFRGIDPEGSILFESSSRYGVDKLTGENVAGYGDADREGYFKFPVNTQPKDYFFHSPEILEVPSTARFLGEEVRDGMTLYHYEYFIDDIEKTQYFPDFLSAGKTVIGNHSGDLWVEPVSGYLVDFEHSGENWFVDGETGERIGNFQEWFNEFSPETVERHMDKARNLRWNVMLHQIFVPLFFLLFGLIFLFIKKK